MWVKGAGCGLELVAAERGSALLLRTYSRATGLFLGGATTDAGEVLEIAG